MFDTAEQLVEKIQLGEDSTIELESVRFRGDRIALSRGDIADEIAAFANTVGGVIVFGVDDATRIIEGIPREKLDTVVDFITEVSNDTIKPAVALRVFRMLLPNAQGVAVPIIKVDIPRSLFVHESPGGYFYRQGGKKRKLSPEALARLFQQRSQVRLIRFDEQAVPQTSLPDLDEGLWRRFAGEGGEAPEVILDKLKLVTTDDAGTLSLTVAGVLLATAHPEAFIPSAIIEAVKYRGNERDANYQEDATIVSAPLDEQVRIALSFVLRNMRTMAIKNPGREEIPQYSIRAVFEALVNAVAHRDYSIAGSKIRLFMFENRLELYSPGTIPNSMTIESMPLRQSTRNETISSLLNRCPVDTAARPEVKRQFMMDKRGEGVPIILKESEALSGKKPMFRLIDDAELLLTIYAATIEKATV
ncbi:MAG: ATP-binding protein [Rectinemataceae bacterium]